MVGQVDVALPKALSAGLKVGLVDCLAVDAHVAACVDIHPVARAADNTLGEHLVVIGEGHEVASAIRGILGGDHDVALVQGRRHGLAVDFKGGEHESREQNRHREDANQCKHNVAPETVPVTHAFGALQLFVYLIDGGKLGLAAGFGPHAS